MSKKKKNTYTCLLMATCFVVSPFIYHKLWKTSSAEKNIDLVPPSTSSISDEAPAPDKPEDVPVYGATEAPAAGSTTPAPADQQAPPTAEAPAEPAQTEYIFVEGDASYFDDALFIGDSRTVGIKEYGTLKNADYFCTVGMMASKIDSETVDGRSFDELIDARQYGKIYVMLGINEVGNDFQFTLTQYRAVVERLKAHQPNAIIYVQANLHVSRSAETKVINNERINYLNDLIAGLADNKKVFYIDINEVYDDAKGYLTESYTSDGIHPKGTYYKNWSDWLCTKELVPNSSVIAEPVAAPTEVTT